MNKSILIHGRAGIALTPQKKIDLFNFPFTLNMNIGCFYGCKYCYLQGYLFSKHAEFGRETKVKLWLPEKLDKELVKYRDLPQHLKRVQVNPATEGLHPKTVKYVQEHYNRDLFRETLEVFRRHWDSGNRWMVHLVTKSNSITNYVDLLADLRHMVQVEIAIITADQQLSRQVEPYAPSVHARLMAVEKLAKAGIFVRIMAMPFITFSSDEERVHQELVALKELAFNHGAVAFKNKGLNYFDEKDVQAGKARHVKGQKNKYFEDLIIKSGEPALDKRGKPRTRAVLMPKSKIWATKHCRERLEKRPEVIVDCGYNILNNVRWGNIR